MYSNAPMSTYVIGDVQGCFTALKGLLALLDFSPAKDRIILLGDLVNRGEDSLSVLRWARDNGIGAILGNHDLHLLSVAAGIATSRTDDTLHAILDAPDLSDLMFWLRQQPLLYHTERHLLVHAGLLPQWHVDQALSLAAEVESALRGKNYRTFLQTIYGNLPDRWNDNLTGYDRLRVITNAMTRLRFCHADGQMDFRAKGKPQEAPAGLIPWFQVPGRRSAGTTIVFGHWSALGLSIHSDCIALDTGCLWGGKLSALRLDDHRLFQIDCAGLAGTRHLQ